jgi:molybdopterin synthase catalytic subunit
MGGRLTGFELEHYPAMTERALRDIEAQARARWPLQASLIIHRYGPLAPGDQIMMVATASAHRQAAFEAAEFLMDYLKSRAPFWKKESTAEGARWVDAREEDEAALERWSAGS